MISSLCEWWGAIRRQQRSPIFALDKNVAASPFRIAPERSEELKSLLNAHNLQIVFVDEAKFGIRVNLETHEVILPVAAMEYVWAQSLRFWIVTQEYRTAQVSGAATFDLHGNERLANASGLVGWSMDNMNATGKEQWPSCLPQPTSKPQSDDGKVANELFLGAMGWIILHEVGHVARGHAEVSGAYSQQQEREADLFATEWVLDKIDPEDPAFTKRAFCIATALLCLQGFETTAAPRWKGSHPPAHERIDYCLNSYGGPMPEKLVAFLVVCLQVLFAKTNVSPDAGDDSFSSILDGLLVSITRENS